jgi:hypothetical protein
MKTGEFTKFLAVYGNSNMDESNIFKKWIWEQEQAISSYQYYQRNWFGMSISDPNQGDFKEPGLGAWVKNWVPQNRTVEYSNKRVSILTLMHTNIISKDVQSGLVEMANSEPTVFRTRRITFCSESTSLFIFILFGISSHPLTQVIH